VCASARMQVQRFVLPFDCCADHWHMCCTACHVVSGRVCSFRKAAFRERYQTAVATAAARCCRAYVDCLAVQRCTAASSDRTPVSDMLGDCRRGTNELRAMSTTACTHSCFHVLHCADHAYGHPRTVWYSFQGRLCCNNTPSSSY
jgi:hypothetical protein